MGIQNETFMCSNWIPNWFSSHEIGTMIGVIVTKILVMISTYVSVSNQLKTRSYKQVNILMEECLRIVWDIFPEYVSGGEIMPGSKECVGHSTGIAIVVSQYMGTRENKFVSTDRIESQGHNKTHHLIQSEQAPNQLIERPVINWWALNRS